MQIYTLLECLKIVLPSNKLSYKNITKETKILIQLNNICRLILSCIRGSHFWCHIFSNAFSTSIHHDTGSSKTCVSKILSFCCEYDLKTLGKMFETMPIVFNYSLHYWVSISILQDWSNIEQWLWWCFQI